MAKRQAQEAQVLSQVLMAPVVAFAAGLKDPNRARTLEKADMDKLLEMTFESAKAIPRIHQAERPARGIKVVDTDPVSNPGSAQGGAEWFQVLPSFTLSARIVICKHMRRTRIRLPAMSEDIPGLRKRFIQLQKPSMVVGNCKVLFNSHPRRGTHDPQFIWMIVAPPNRASHCVHISSRHQKSIFARRNTVFRPGTIASNHRQSGRHCFQKRQREPFIHGWKYEDV
jgi:hypothetical protein